MPIYKTDVKKDGLTQYRVRVAYTDSNGKHRQRERTAYGMTAAKEAERLLQQELAAPVPATVPKMTVQQLYDEFIKAKTAELRTTSLRKNESILKCHVLPTLGSTSLDALTLPVLQNWKNEMSGKDLGLTMRQHAYDVFRALLNYAVKLEYLPTNPLVKLGNFRDAYAAPKRESLHYYTADQFRLYIAAAEERCRTLYDWGIYVFFCIAYYTGMRKGEINALRWSDLDGSLLHVRRSVSQKVKGESVVETPPKNKSSYRTLQMPAPLIAVLAAHKARQQADSRWSEEYRVCGGPSVISDTALSNRNTEYADAAGLPHIRIHDFRHSHASLLCNSGINIQEIARRLGHSNIEQTWSTYAHLYPREEERAVAVLNTITLDGKKNP